MVSSDARLSEAYWSFKILINVYLALIEVTLSYSVSINLLH